MCSPRSFDPRRARGRDGDDLRPGHHGGCLWGDLLRSLAGAWLLMGAKGPARRGSSRFFFWRGNPAIGLWAKSRKPKGTTKLLGFAALCSDKPAVFLLRLGSLGVGVKLGFCKGTQQNIGSPTRPCGGMNPWLLCRTGGMAQACYQGWYFKTTFSDKCSPPPRCIQLD